MGHYYSREEELVLDALRSSDILTFEQLSIKLPELTWNQLFHIVDGLSREGEINLRRRGYEYELQKGSSSAIREADKVLN